MKKILPVIILLITISFIGLIYLQYTWFTNLLQVKSEQLKQQGLNAVQMVGKELDESFNRSNFSKGSKNNWKQDYDVMALELLKPSTISQKFSLYEIQQKLDAAFKKSGIEKLSYEFAVAQSKAILTYEMVSPGFSQNNYDSANDHQFVYFLEPPSGTFADGLVPNEILVVVIPHFKQLVFKSSYIELGGSVIFTLFIMFAFFFTARALLNQKKLSEIKSDFINNMTHEFKTPLATISLAVDALKNEKVLNDREKLEYFSGIIKEENKRMNSHVETILQAALLERQQLNLNKVNIHVHSLLKKVLDNFNLQIEDKRAVIKLSLEALKDVVFADEMHFSNVFNNLIDNALKYSKEQLTLKISTKNISEFLIVCIEDNGIGMSRETAKRVFEKFYRAHTGNIHNIKGFGLGMSYVKTIIDAHKGEIKVDSTLGKGTNFTIKFPLAKV